MFTIFAQGTPITTPDLNLGGTVRTSSEALQNSFGDAWHKIVSYTPNLLAAIVVLVVGYFVAKMVAHAVTLLCERAGLQRAAERSGLWESMTHMNIKRNVPAILGTIVFWGLMLVFLMAGFSILNISQVSGAIDRVVEYIPNVLVATVMVVVGLLVAGFLRGVIATSADRMGVSYAEHLANGCYYIMSLMVFMAAFDQLKIHFELLNYAILIAFGGAALGFGLALGLGGRDTMSGILAGYYVRQRLQAGDHVTVGHLEGTVREVGPVATIIETDEDGLLNRHSVPNSKMLNEAVR
ncbi:MAG TPA: mechanosensitive ion channel domain-containing protein [Pirellulales bacterium]|jgi:small-conductance mechanosensitive channel